MQSIRVHSTIFFFLLGLVCFGGVWGEHSLVSAATSRQQKQKKKNAAKNIGDVSFRFDSGVELFRFSVASGEPDSEMILERALRLRLNFEYGYFMDDTLTLFLSLPIEFNIDPIVGTRFDLDMGVGFRKFFARIFYIDARALLSFFSRSHFSFVFGGFVLGVGAAIPMNQQVRLLISARMPLYFIGGFRLRIQTFVGVEALF